MLSIVIVLPKLEDANAIKALLVRNGFEVHAVCTTGAQAVSIANELDRGIVISGYRMSDMSFREINTYLPRCFEMLLLVSAARISEVTGDNIMAVSMPLRTKDFLDTIQMMLRRSSVAARRSQHTKQESTGSTSRGRSEAEKAVIEKAKLVLMQRNHMTEEEAHRYIQKNSMDSGTNLTEMAEMILSML
ncbi:MAG: ANTAR domain-containing protein [Lachnospiraceae bacterium]|nr:ANTAR domain-containing protein [Lachnospiraceae bacterium]